MRGGTEKYDTIFHIFVRHCVCWKCSKQNWRGKIGEKSKKGKEKSLWNRKKKVLRRQTEARSVTVMSHFFSGCFYDDALALSRAGSGAQRTMKRFKTELQWRFSKNMKKSKGIASSSVTCALQNDCERSHFLFCHAASINYFIGTRQYGNTKQ